MDFPGRLLMKRGQVLAALLVAGSLSVAVVGYQGPPAGQGGAGAGGGGQRAAAPVVLTPIKVRDNLFMLTGAGGNTAVFVQANGVTLVDTKNPNTGQPIVDQVRAITNKPITTIINTH